MIWGIDIVKMKILHIYKSYYPYTHGGVEKHIQSLSESLCGVGVESGVLTTYSKDTPIYDAVGKTPVYYFPSNICLASCPFSLSLLKNFRNIARNYDILHFHFPWPFADLLQLLNWVGKPAVVTYHSDIIRQEYLKWIYYPVMQWFLRQSQAIIVSSQNYVNSSLVLDKFRDKIRVIPFGLDRSQLAAATTEKIDYWRKRVGENFFLFVGVLRYYKGLDFLLQALHQTPIKVVIAGSGPEEARLKQIKAEKNLDNVIFTGTISESDKAALFHLCRACVAPSHLRTEAYCYSLLESLAYGKPAISTELNTGTSFVNKHNVSGLVVEAANPKALRTAMQRLLQDELYYSHLKAGAMQHFTSFNTDSMVKKHLDLYEALVHPKSVKNLNLKKGMHGG